MKRKSGRVILLFGLLLVILVAVGAFLLFSGGGGGGLGGIMGAPPTATARAETVVKPIQFIGEGTYISSTELFTTDVSTRTEDQGSDMVRDPAQVTGKVALTDLLQDKALRKSQLGEPGLAYRIASGKRALSIEVDQLSGIVGLIKKNDYVDVVLSGIVEEYLPQTFPLSIQYISPPPELRPEFIPFKFPWSDVEPFRLLTVKTVVEDIRVLEVISLTSQAAVKTSATPTPGPAALPAGWILVVEVTEQQAEVLRFAVEQAWPFQLMLRPYNERTPVHDPNTTTGVSTWILLDPNGNYRMPLPRAITYPVSPGTLPVGLVP